MKKQLHTFFRSLKNAGKGILSVARAEINFKIQLTIGLAVLILMIILPLAPWERILLILMISAVLVLEILNTAFERISDALKPRLSPVVKEVKDIMAGAVLLTSITAVLVATLVFWSYLFN
ncbi:diacylglycerol kinase [Candidatus Uhrbacteria bacterium CG_4_10_14_0_2_um_filter_41_7]|uniref:Diacylglycerol kinase n=1 Tax=Candidatus Uhrbacteria bacterium CG_4_9_14_3_um_filter_41_35 TaxID=1975034 RepID=A0A2M7XEH6_9BACT|nr:MAG: diacylglycerol kinase [Candidatus Uhrbacteria bacterium CG11_big_fil_rev_8_21_14_0_20_41_9]PIZ54995.1 MAG: diacylglycerol kinase [Candidatus Uhrbacteria bacterium CG_4_10_14_0_2_um_filter_41_7]PJA46289.1 MAG: diacylglycerol kinase [Candidatus Uhrbacteria bacterium CG_4_9_14_3_um_filter_41_35]